MEELIPIGRVAEAAQVSQKALRLYDEQGVLPPAHVDEESGYRLYRPEQIRDARLIHFLRRADMPLAEVREFLDDPDVQRLDAYERRLEAELAARRKALAIVRRILSVEATFEVDEKHVEPVLYAARRREVPAAEVENFIRDSLRALAAAHEASGRPFAIYHEVPKEDREADVEVGLPAADGDRELPAGAVAFTTLSGEQARDAGIIAAYDAVWDWAHVHKRDFAGPPRELYSEDESGLTIELQWPVS